MSYFNLKVVALIIWWVLVIGFIAPALVSAANTSAVLLGVVLLLGSAWVSAVFVKRVFVEESSPKTVKKEVK